jgi:hypothetical protein
MGRHLKMDDIARAPITAHQFRALERAIAPCTQFSRANVCDALRAQPDLSQIGIKDVEQAVDYFLHRLSRVGLIVFDAKTKKYTWE